MSLTTSEIPMSDTPRPARDNDRATYMRIRAARRSNFVKQNQSRRVYTLMRTAIRKGIIARGSNLDESTLMSQFAATRGAVREALVRLAQDGLVHRSPGAGTRVAEFSEGIEIGRRQGSTRPFEIETLFSGLVPGSPVIRDQLQLPDGSAVRAAEYLLRSDGNPFCVETIYWAPDIAPRVPFVATSGDDLPSSFLRHFGVALGRSTTAVDAIVGDESTTAILGVANRSPLLLSEKLLYGTDGVARELQYIHYAAGRSYFVASTEYETESPPS
jgi:GntR family transcriptional regulator